jgi:hypothetical protein
MTMLTAGVVVAAAAVPVAASPAAAIARRTAPVGPPRWRVVAVPSSVVSSASLEDVSASGPASAWAVGAEAETAQPDGSLAGTPLILHWNGRAWAKVALRGVPAPGFFSTVSAGSRSNAWVLGTDRSGTVLLHWNGRRLRTVRFPEEATAFIASVAATPDGRAWLVGSRLDSAGNPEILVERWNGAAWHIVATGLGHGHLYTVRASASGDIWARGLNSVFQSLIVHEHHGVWTSFLGPADLNDVTDVLGVSAHDVWAVGGYVTVTPITATAEISHWNGRGWTTVELPSTFNIAVSISPGRSGKPQWAGLGFGGSRSSLYAHFNGTTWSLVRGATPLRGMLEAFTVNAHIPGTDATSGVGGTTVGFINDVKPFRAIIEFNPG